MKYSASLAVLAATLFSMGLAGEASAQTVPANVPLQKDDSVVDPVVITATRDTSGIDKGLIGSSVTVISPQQMEERQIQVVSDVLRDVPGVAVNRTGTVGDLTQVRIRGAEGNHTLVLIDGIKASDPFADEFDFATLIADDVSKVEVLRGEQSALYGSDAIGGVISYITASGKEAPGFRARIEGGSFGTEQGSLRFAGVTHGLDYALSGNYLYTDGIPVAPCGKRDVGSTIGAVALKLGYDFNEHLKARGVFRYSYTNADTDDQDFSTTGFAIDSNAFFNNRAIYWLGELEHKALGGHWTNTFTIQGADSERKGYEFAALSFGDVGDRLKGSYVTNYKFDTGRFEHSLTGAFDVEHNTFHNIDPTGFADVSEHTIDTEGLVLQYDGVFDKRWSFGAAYRHDWNDLFQAADTFHLQTSYRFDQGTRIHAAGGSGIKNPGPFELFAFSPFLSFRGNPNLKPETSIGWEAGIEQSFLNRRAVLDVTYFDSTLDDEITTNFSVIPNTPINITGHSTRRGVEVSGRIKLPSGFHADVAYTHLDAKQAGVEELRRAPDIASANIGWRSADNRLGANLTVRYNGDQTDTNFVTFNTVTLKDFTLVNLGADYKLTNRLTIYGRVENLADTKYQEVFGYNEPGRAAYVGLKFGF